MISPLGPILLPALPPGLEIERRKKTDDHDNRVTECISQKILFPVRAEDCFHYWSSPYPGEYTQNGVRAGL